MGGGNAQKSKMAREKNMEKMKAAGKGIFILMNLCLFYMFVFGIGKGF